MAARKDTKTPTNQKGSRASAPDVDAVEAHILAAAEQFGRILGTVQATTEGWLDRAGLSDQLTRIRDGATRLLDSLERGASSATPARTPAARPRTTAGASANRGRSGGNVDAPGKAHRPLSASARGVKHSDQTVSKIKGAETLRRGHRRG